MKQKLIAFYYKIEPIFMIVYPGVFALFILWPQSIFTQVPVISLFALKMLALLLTGEKPNPNPPPSIPIRIASLLTTLVCIGLLLYGVFK